MRVEVQLRNLPDTRAAVGWAGGHTVIADRPAGTAGGLGLGFNGAQLLALAIGGCFCNDLRYVAEQDGADIAEIAITVQLEMAGTPLLATGAEMVVHCRMTDGADPTPIIDRASSSCMVSNSLARGIPVVISTTRTGPST